MMEKPKLTCTDVVELVQTLYGLDVTSQRNLNSYDDVNVHVLVNKLSNNTHIPETSVDGYVLKILNSIDSKKVEFVDATHTAIALVSQDGIITSHPVQNLSGSCFSLETLTSNIDDNGASKCEFLVRLFQYVPGEILLGKPYTPRLCFQVGQLAAKLDKALQNLHEPCLANHNRHWDLKQTLHLGNKAQCIDDETDRQLVLTAVDEFKENAVANYARLQKGVIHADLNEGNLLVKQIKLQSAQDAAEYEIHGILDFGDMVDGYHVFEVAIAMMYMMIESTILDPIDAGGHVLAGYLDVFELPALDKHILKECAIARLAQSLAYGAFEHKQDPDNAYCLQTAARGWPLLRRLSRIPKHELYARWQNILDAYGLYSKLNTSN